MGRDVKVKSALDMINSKEYSIEELELLKKTIKPSYDKVVKRLFCPNCKNASIFVKISKKGNLFFATYRNLHDDNCDYKDEPLSAKESKDEYYKNNENVSKKMENMLRNELAKITGISFEKISQKKKNKDIDTSISATEEGNKSKNSTINMHKLNRKLSIEDENVYKIYYGIVKIIKLYKDTSKWYINFTILDLEEKGDKIKIGLHKDQKISYEYIEELKDKKILIGLVGVVKFISKEFEKNREIIKYTSKEISIYKDGDISIIEIDE